MSRIDKYVDISIKEGTKNLILKIFRNKDIVNEDLLKDLNITRGDLEEDLFEIKTSISSYKI